MTSRTVQRTAHVVAWIGFAGILCGGITGAVTPYVGAADIGEIGVVVLWIGFVLLIAGATVEGATSFIWRQHRRQEPGKPDTRIKPAP